MKNKDKRISNNEIMRLTGYINKISEFDYIDDFETQDIVINMINSLAYISRDFDSDAASKLSDIVKGMLHDVATKKKWSNQ